MGNYTIRPLTMADAPQAAKLWSLVFGDEETLIHEFFRLFARCPHFGLCAELDGSLTAAAYCPDGMDCLSPTGTVSKGAYLYAVATHPDHRKRGLARLLCQGLRDAAFAHGMDYVFTKPSEESLYPWYTEAIGAVPVLGADTSVFTAAGTGSLTPVPLTPEAYYELREQCMAHLPHIRHSLQWLQWESLLHSAYGGGFYRVGDAIADLYMGGTELQICELLPTVTDSGVQSLLSAFHADGCTCAIRGDAPYVSAVSKTGGLPMEGTWFGPCYG